MRGESGRAIRRRDTRPYHERRTAWSIARAFVLRSLSSKETKPTACANTTTRSHKVAGIGFELDCPRGGVLARRASKPPSTHDTALFFFEKNSGSLSRSLLFRDFFWVRAWVVTSDGRRGAYICPHLADARAANLRPGLAVNFASVRETRAHSEVFSFRKRLCPRRIKGSKKKLFENRKCVYLCFIPEVCQLDF